ncbi:hypothetical protein [Flavobacterium sp. ACAM 123]|uniref:hypothetical protein n=1 Tax=Flavobacterium sp. ACAM 123 TaxID=1189620 RepID=UPI0002F97A71|nr:hypothetical protein [Flavobacterium sp. ACAM 123]
MKISKQNRQNAFFKRQAKSKNLFWRIFTKAFSSSWGIGALLAALSAWTAGILYV